MREGVLLPSLHRPLPTPTPGLSAGPYFWAPVSEDQKLEKAITEGHPDKVHQDVLNTLSLLW